MSTALRQRPAEARDNGRGGGAAARRAVIRWAWRLFRREWRQQLLVLALLSVAVAATVLGAAVGSNAPSSPMATFGNANHLVVLPGSDRTLAADLAAIRQRFGTIGVIEHQRLSTGSVNPVDLRAQDPKGPFGSPMLRLDAGRYPARPGEVAVTSQVASLYNLHVGDLWNAGGHALRVVGLVENPGNLLDSFALVAPGQISAPTQVTVLFNASEARITSFAFPGGVSAETPPPPPAGFSPAIVVLALSTFGLIFIGLVAVAGFTVMAQRRLRALGMLSSLGATDRDVRLVLLANGAVVGVVATLAGAAAGFLAWVAYAPRLQTSTGHRIDRLNLPWWAIGTAMGLAVVTAVAAARRPARSAARMPVVAALSGRPATPKAAHRSAVPGAVLLVAGLGLLWFSGGWGGSSNADQLKTLGGIAATALGSLLLAPLCVAALGAIGGHAPVGARVALRDLARYRARSGGPRGGHLRGPDRRAHLRPRHRPVRQPRRLLRAQPPREPAGRLRPGRHPGGQRRPWLRADPGPTAKPPRSCGRDRCRARDARRPRARLAHETGNRGHRAVRAAHRRPDPERRSAVRRHPGAPRPLRDQSEPDRRQRRPAHLACGTCQHSPPVPLWRLRPRDLRQPWRSAP